MLSCAYSTWSLGQQFTWRPIVPTCWARTAGQTGSPSRALWTCGLMGTTGAGSQAHLALGGRGSVQDGRTWEARWLQGVWGTTVRLWTPCSCRWATDGYPLNDLNVILG